MPRRPVDQGALRLRLRGFSGLIALGDLGVDLFLWRWSVKEERKRETKRGWEKICRAKKYFFSFSFLRASCSVSFSSRSHLGARRGREARLVVAEVGVPLNCRPRVRPEAVLVALAWPAALGEQSSLFFLSGRGREREKEEKTGGKW